MEPSIHNIQYWNKIFNEENYYASKPSDEEIEIYKHLIEKYTKGKNSALILGATASLRDICLEAGFKTTVVDINKDVIENMKNFMIPNNQNNERIMIKNWLEIDEKNRYDLVIGDASFNNIAWEEYTKLLLIIRRALKNEGIFILRQFVYNKNIKLRKPEEIIEEFRTTRKLRNLKYNLRMNSKISWSSTWYNQQNFESYWRVYFDYIRELFEKKLLTENEFNNVYKEAHKIISVFPPIELWEKLLRENNFFILAKERAEEYSYTVYTPIYVAKVMT